MGRLVKGNEGEAKHEQFLVSSFILGKKIVFNELISDLAGDPIDKRSSRRGCSR